MSQGNKRGWGGHGTCFKRDSPMICIAIWRADRPLCTQKQKQNKAMRRPNGRNTRPKPMDREKKVHRNYGVPRLCCSTAATLDP